MAHATSMFCASNVRYAEGEKDKRKLPIFPFCIFQILCFEEKTIELEEKSTSGGKNGGYMSAVGCFRKVELLCIFYSER